MCSRNNSPCIPLNCLQVCPVSIGNNICGEDKSLEILEEFNQLYEERIQQVDFEAKVDFLQEQNKLQEEWIQSLIQQNKMLVRAVEELEYEATERIKQLEKKPCSCKILSHVQTQEDSGKICCLLDENEINLTKHDEAIVNIKKNLCDSLLQNKKLQKTVENLTEYINKLQTSVNQYEEENCCKQTRRLEFEDKISSCCVKLKELKNGLDKKTAESIRLKMAYNNEKRALEVANKRLQEAEVWQKENQNKLVTELKDLKQQLKHSNDNKNRLYKKYETLQKHMANISRKEAVKDLEIKRYRKIVGDLKATMIELNSELNKNIIKKEQNNECTYQQISNTKNKQDVCLRCPCEVEFYQKMVNILKKSVQELKHKLSNSEQKNKELISELKLKDETLCDIRRQRDILACQLQECCIDDQKIVKLQQEVDQLRHEIQVKSLQLNDVKRSCHDTNDIKCVHICSVCN